MKILITEAQEEQILNGQKNLPVDKILNHLRRHYPVQSFEMDKEFEDFYGKYRILIDDKYIPIKEKKKLIMNLIFLEIEELFHEYGIKTIRQAIRSYINSFSDI